MANSLAVQLAPFIESATKALVQWGTAGERAGAKIVNAFNWVLRGMAKIADFVELLKAAWHGLQATISTVSAKALQVLTGIPASLEQAVRKVTGKDETRIWKACISYGDGNYERLQTDLPDNVIECCPTAWQDKQGWHVSFIAGGGALGPRYHLFRMDGPALDRLSPPVALAQTKTGFVYKERMAVGEPQDLVHVHDHSGDRTIELPGANIYRVSYRADIPHKLLISGKWLKESEIFTLEYDLKTQEQHFIEADGQAAYKCSIFGNEILFADRVGKHFESQAFPRLHLAIRKARKDYQKKGRLPDWQRLEGMIVK